MKFAVKAWSNGGRARTGVLQLSNCPLPIETPSLLLTTRKGLPVFIAPDLLLSLPSPDSHLLHSTLGSAHDLNRTLTNSFVFFVSFKDFLSLLFPSIMYSIQKVYTLKKIHDKQSKTKKKDRKSLKTIKRNHKIHETCDSAGFWIGGFGLGDSMDERPALLNAVVDNLPKEKPRQICGLGLPEEILQGVAAGIDLFDSTYIYQLTLGGFALTFPLNRSESQFSDSCMSDSSGSDNTKINLRATIYRKDASPIVDGCGCYTCKNHTRAYINHLINVHEMLAQILLEMEAIREGEFDVFCQEFIHGRRDHIAMAAMC
ncbi:hypothetical protein MKX01_023255 [Papaver californicum]|nr:hypothetical protein MKX01_023255 [Papaver californicum]